MNSSIQNVVNGQDYVGGPRHSEHATAIVLENPRVLDIGKLAPGMSVSVWASEQYTESRIPATFAGMLFRSLPEDLRPLPFIAGAMSLGERQQCADSGAGLLLTALIALCFQRAVKSTSALKMLSGELKAGVPRAVKETLEAVSD